MQRIHAIGSIVAATSSAKEARMSRSSCMHGKTAMATAFA